MKDAIGIKLLNIRKKKIVPLIRGKLLDVGCGTNEIVKDYRVKTGEEAVGIDVYPWDGVDMVVKNSAKLDFPDDYFDTVICVSALNHIPNRGEVILEMKRVVENDGQIIVTMIPPGISHLWHKIREPWDVDQKERGMKPGEVFGFTKREIINMFENAGLKLVKIKPFMLRINRVYIFKRKSV